MFVQCRAPTIPNDQPKMVWLVFCFCLFFFLFQQCFSFYLRWSCSAVVSTCKKTTPAVPGAVPVLSKQLPLPLTLSLRHRRKHSLAASTGTSAAVTLLLHLSNNHPARQVEVVDVTGAVIITQGPEHLPQGATHDLTTPVTGD